jgi:hypothetical protein
MTVHDPMRETEEFAAMRDALRRAVTCPTAEELTRRERRRRRQRARLRKRSL